MLYLVATPIGNLSDLSQRALSTLSSSDLILCEDTRRSLILLNHFGIKKPLLAYHKFNEKKELQRIIDRLQSGETISLISDAGTPCIADPGHILIEACIANHIPFTTIGGCCSPIQALLLSGLSTERFQFLGFLPKTPRSTLEENKAYPGTTIFLESPERIGKTLKIFAEIDPNRKVAIVREMTKTFEECIRGTVTEVLDLLKNKEIRGEVVLVIEKGSIDTLDMSIEELVSFFQTTCGLSLKEAIQKAALCAKIPKKIAYQKVHKK